jgi:hypothetical protein
VQAVQRERVIMKMGMQRLQLVIAIMATLTSDEKKFLEYHGIPLSWTFDASGMKKKEYKKAMHEEEKFIAYGLNFCPRADHTLRTPSGSCPQCDTSSIAYILRHRRKAHVYIAGSIEKRLIKVGTSADPPTLKKRICILNVNSYGGASDWRLLSHIDAATDASKFEIAIHKDLQHCLTQVSYFNSGNLTVTMECFSCSYSMAKLSLLDNFDPSDWELLQEQEEVNQYEFD